MIFNILKVAKNYYDHIQKEEPSTYVEVRIISISSNK